METKNTFRRLPGRVSLGPADDRHRWAVPEVLSGRARFQALFLRPDRCHGGGQAITVGPFGP
jgi:hypothetical protein